MRIGDLDDVMEVERVCFRAPWSRQVFIEELERDCLNGLLAGVGVLAWPSWRSLPITKKKQRRDQS